MGRKNLLVSKMYRVASTFTNKEEGKKRGSYRGNNKKKGFSRFC
jgi:hypothetical protein